MTTVSLLFLNRQINEMLQLRSSVLDVTWSAGLFPGRWRERGSACSCAPTGAVLGGRWEIRL